MPLIVVASPAYVTRSGVPRVPKDLERHDCINVIFSRSERSRWTFTREGDSSRHRIHVRPKGHVLVMDELDAAVDAAVAGLGVTVTSVDNVLAQLRDGRLVQLLETHAVSGPNQRSSQVIIQLRAPSSTCPTTHVCWWNSSSRTSRIATPWIS